MLTNVNGKITGELDEEQFKEIIPGIVMNLYHNAEFLEEVIALLPFAEFSKVNNDDELDEWDEYCFIEEDYDILFSLILSPDRTLMHIGVFPCKMFKHEYNITERVIEATADVLESEEPEAPSFNFRIKN